ncbi:TIGR01777 family oxidoreductase [Terriglobus roseus]|uniref:TIGR01777 family protein n=1 Tax=Terriglobus roseus TaxID=392734 RepID=A0A1H4IRZ7_9BACT|nr:TIGR01777 family oxidoreductase [Terriglobus roseus]SEB36864.1 hypothetical protein SAMN05443244_0014 [Terriglobus roseus]
MKIIIPGGSGQVGTMLAKALHARGDDVLVLSRKPSQAPWRTAAWDGTTAGTWVCEIDGADAVIHLSGRSVNCRYTPENRKQIVESRTLTTRAVGEAIGRAKHPPRVWLNAATSTVYRHSIDKPQDEFTGEWGGAEPGVPETWSFSVGVGRQWEAELNAAPTPATRRIALRTSMVMSPDTGGVFDVLLGLVRHGLGGTQGNGNQYVSWMHDQDFVRATLFLLENENISGPVNMCAPRPVPNRDFMRELRLAAGHRLGLPATAAMLEVGAIFVRTETELILKSRRVAPAVLEQAGFDFHFPEWPSAAKNLVRRWRVTHG